MNLKAIYQKYKGLIQPILYCKNRLFGFHMHCSGHNNRIEGLGVCRAKHVHISISGSDNHIVIGDMSSLFDVSINIHGSGNTILIGNRNYLTGMSFCVEDNGNEISTGEHTYIYNNTEISAIESTSIQIGDDCLFSGNIMIRSGDSHVIFDKDSKERINASQNISIAEHVWLGNDCKVLKGSAIAKDCVVAAGAIITSGTKQEENAVFAGSPAKAVRHGINWSQIR